MLILESFEVLDNDLEDIEQVLDVDNVLEDRWIQIAWLRLNIYQVDVILDQYVVNIVEHCVDNIVEGYLDTILDEVDTILDVLEILDDCVDIKCIIVDVIDLVDVVEHIHVDCLDVVECEVLHARYQSNFW